MFTETIKESVSIPGAQLAPIDQGAGTVVTGSVDMSKFNRAMFLAQVGVVGAGGTLDLKLQESVDNVTFTDVASGALTQIIASAKIATAELRADQLSGTNRYARLSATVAVASIQLSMCAFGFIGRYPPVNNNDVAAVTQRKVL